MQTEGSPFIDPSNTPTGGSWGRDTFWLGIETTKSPRLVQRYIVGSTDPNMFVPVFGLKAGELGLAGSTQPTILSGLRVQARFQAQALATPPDRKEVR